MDTEFEVGSSVQQEASERDENAELRAALEYRLGIKPDVYAIADIFEITVEALRSRGLPLEASVGMRKHRLSADPSATNGGASVHEHGRRRLDDALLLLALVNSEHLIQGVDS